MNGAVAPAVAAAGGGCSTAVPRALLLRHAIGWSGCNHTDVFGVMMHVETEITGERCRCSQDG